MTMVAERTSQSVVASYKSHEDAEEAVRQLQHSGIPMPQISLIGKDWRAREDVQGYYQPADAVREGAGTGAWFGGIFGLFLGFGLFVFPIAGALIVLGPLAGFIAGAIGGTGVGALIGALVSLGIPKEQAIKYQTRLEAGEWLVIVHGGNDDIQKAHLTLQNSGHVELQMHDTSAPS